MLSEWTDRLPPREAAEIHRRLTEEAFEKRLSALERSIGRDVASDRIVPASFYQAMHHFLELRATLFRGLSTDPVWQILVTLAREPELGERTSVTSIAYGADVPLTTALRYIAALEIEGVVERVPCATDKRRVFIRLTEEGSRRLEMIADKWVTRLVWALVIPCVMLTVLT